jgi:hypothetical protein
VTTSKSILYYAIDCLSFPVRCPVCCALAFNNVDATTKGGKLELNLVGHSTTEVQHGDNGIKKQILMAQLEQAERFEKQSIGPDGGRFIQGFFINSAFV